MSEDSKSDDTEDNVQFLFLAEEQSSGEEPPMSEWSSLEIVLPEENKKRLLFEQGMYSGGSGEICTKYICMSDSSVFRHPYYKYPAVIDPGIKQAILSPENPIIYPDDGQKLYLALCLEMNVCPVGIFHRNLLCDEINLSYYGLNPAGVRPMAMALQFNKFVRRFDLTDNFLNDDACYHLGRMLSSNTTLTELILTGCRIGSTGMLHLGYTLPLNRSLISLNLARNNIGESGGVHFTHQLLAGATVGKYNLSNNQLGKQTASAIAEALQFQNKLTHLDLSWNNFFFAATTVKMLDALSQSQVLQELSLAWNSLEGDRIASSIKNIMLVPTLMILDLSNNRFQGEAVATILTNLYKAKKLITLDLSLNPLSPEDAQAAIEKMLKPRVKLENLYLENVCVKNGFLTCLERVRKMKSRKNFVVTYGKVLQNWSVSGPDQRELLLRRANYLGNANKRRKVDVALFFLQLNKEYTKPVPVKELMDRINADNVPLDEDLVSELTYVFPGPKSSKTRSVNLQPLCEYVQRMWPDKKLPPTPPPEPEPELDPPEPPPPPPPKIKKGKGKK